MKGIHQFTAVHIETMNNITADKLLMITYESNRKTLTQHSLDRDVIEMFNHLSFYK